MKIKHFVRQSLFFSLFLGGMGLGMMPSQVHAENLPDIEAHQFKIVPLEKSRTGRVYRFKSEAEQLPRIGNILLIEENEKPTMAFRVMKTDPLKSEFIAKRVRRYDVSSELKINDRYTTVEKISDLVSPPPAEPKVFNPNATPLLDPNPTPELAANPPTTAAPPVSATQAPIEPLTGSAATPSATVTPPLPADPGTFTAATPAPANPGMDVEKYDNDLDSSTSPTNMKSNADGIAGAGAAPPPEPSADDTEYDLEVKERTVLNPYKYMAGISVGSYRNISSLQFGNAPAGGFSAYFSQVIRRNVVFKKAYPQDSLSMEFGLTYYSLTNVTGNGDNYDLLPLKVELRYDMHLSESFTPFVYLGLQYNLIFSSSGIDNTNTSIVQQYNNLHGAQVNIGGGILYNIGPQWYLRADIGLDRFALGLAIRW